MNGFFGDVLISAEQSQKLREGIEGGRNVYCKGLFLSARWFVVAQCAGDGVQLVVLPDREKAEYCAADLYQIVQDDIVFFLPDSGKGVERSNYKSLLSVQRTAAVGKLMQWSSGNGPLYLVTYPEALEEQVPASSFIRQNILRLEKGMEIPFDTIKEKLSGQGFERVDFVSAPGQYAVRGSIIDVFSYAYNDPYRISFFGNEVESIHLFDCNTQLSKQDCDVADIYPDLDNSPQEELTSLTAFLPEGTVVWADAADLYMERPFYGELDRFVHVFLDKPLPQSQAEVVTFHIAPQPVFRKNFEMLAADIRRHQEYGYTVFLLSERMSQVERYKSIFEQSTGVMPSFICGKNIHEGFIDHDAKICCYTDHEVFDRFHRVKIRRTVEKSEQLTLNDIAAFNIGDYIVHIDHGIGIFGGLVKMKDDKGRMKEVVKLMYRDGDVVFVSVHSLNKISRFRSKEGEAPRIGKLGSKSWQTLKAGAKSRIKDIAKELIQLYAKRKASKGYAYSPDSYLQEELESSFMYEDTPDQESATKAVKRDMEDTSPMDRLICGDVGFGKTEIAVRAAFKAVTDGKQVAVLVPTTILALQHYTTFCARLKEFPCSVDYVSRLRTASEVRSIRERLANGTLDIVIGTHKILGKTFEFKDLGLLIIDEEQKFGVAAKERLRYLKSNVDTLTLTATPIPRTLQFSLLGARDLSIISTPPPNRIPVQTEIILFNPDEIKGILNYELNRGGQVFFMHNKVEELPAIHDILHRLVPDASICVAHGQMESKELENRMLDFIRGDYDILLCTTIIENGLDIPNANTILINQAQNIGLSDLHQLRGRVGRSNKKAFCYLIVPPLVSITEDARKRLKAIEEFSDLGSGFNIAMQDLDIRGAGNLLGAEQSGFIMDMGYETYQKILMEAMEELGVETGYTGGVTEDSFRVDCTVETDQTALIPDTYIDIPAEKIRIYKQLDSLLDERELDRLHSQMEDRFGPLPPEADNLFDVVKVRNAGGRLGFEKIIIKNGMMIFFFLSNQMSPYFRSDTFEGVIRRLDDLGGSFVLKQSEGKLKIVTRGVDSMTAALAALKKLQ